MRVLFNWVQLFSEHWLTAPLLKLCVMGKGGTRWPARRPGLKGIPQILAKGRRQAQTQLLYKTEDDPGYFKKLVETVSPDIDSGRRAHRRRTLNFREDGFPRPKVEEDGHFWHSWQPEERRGGRTRLEASSASKQCHCGAGVFGTTRWEQKAGLEHPAENVRVRRKEFLSIIIQEMPSQSVSG